MAALKEVEAAKALVAGQAQELASLEAKCRQAQLEISAKKVGWAQPGPERRAIPSCIPLSLRPSRPVACRLRTTGCAARLRS